MFFDYVIFFRLQACLGHVYAHFKKKKHPARIQIYIIQFNIRQILKKRKTNINKIYSTVPDLINNCEK